MAYAVITAQDFEEDVRDIISWIMHKWTIREVDNFEKKLIAAIFKISINPKIGKVSSKAKDVRSFIVTGHNRLYYQIFNDHIALLRLVEVQQDPNKNKFE